jgi:hypothetical protein
MQLQSVLVSMLSLAAIVRVKRVDNRTAVWLLIARPELQMAVYWCSRKGSTSVAPLTYLYELRMHVHKDNWRVHLDEIDSLHQHKPVRV